MDANARKGILDLENTHGCISCIYHELLTTPGPYPAFPLMSDQTPTSGVIAIRTATLADAEAIATVHIAAWRAAYKSIVPQTHLDNLCFDDRVKLWQRILSEPEPHAGVLVAETPNPTTQTPSPTTILGFASFGPAAAETPSASNDTAAKTAELRAIYIAPQHWGKGIGKRLWEWLEQNFLTAEMEYVVVRVFAGNQSARGFYRAVGFGEERDGGMTEVGGKKLGVLRLRKRLV